MNPMNVKAVREELYVKTVDQIREKAIRLGVKFKVFVNDVDGGCVIGAFNEAKETNIVYEFPKGFFKPYAGIHYPETDGDVMVSLGKLMSVEVSLKEGLQALLGPEITHDIETLAETATKVSDSRT